jgi:hypothetical protein
MLRFNRYSSLKFIYEPTATGTKLFSLTEQYKLDNTIGI